MVQFDLEQPKDEDSDVQDRPRLVPRRLSDENEVDKRARLSMVSRQYDVDGDGVLDEAEQAMRNLDKSGRGFLKTDEVYSMMNDHLKMQKDMFKMKKVISGLVAFTVLLAISNLGTSLAAAWLSKDTTTSNGSFVDKSTNKSLSTQQEKKNFQANPVSDERRRELVEGCITSRRKLNGNSSNSPPSNVQVQCTVHDFLAINHNHGQEIIEGCVNGNNLSVCLDLQFDGFDSTSTQTTHLCKPLCGPSVAFEFADNGSNGSKKVWLSGKVDVDNDGTHDATITCSEDDSAGCVIDSGNYFKQAIGGGCDSNSHCVSNNCFDNACAAAEPAVSGCTSARDCSDLDGATTECNNNVCEWRINSSSSFLD